MCFPPWWPCRKVKTERCHISREPTQRSNLTHVTRTNTVPSRPFLSRDRDPAFFSFSPLRKYETGPVRSMADVDAELALLQM